MEVDGGGDESAAAAMADPGRGKKRPPSPSTPPTPSDDGEDSDDSCAVSDEEEEEDEDEGEEDQEGMHRPFTVDDFPRLSSDHSAQTEARHWFGSDYRLDDESEINVNSARTVDCLNGCRCHSMNLLQLIDL
nr:histone-lysine N-methyltransferase SETD1B isoform X4 [Oryza sativa Japonica Group]